LTGCASHESFRLVWWRKRPFQFPALRRWRVEGPFLCPILRRETDDAVATRTHGDSETRRESRPARRASNRGAGRGAIVRPDRLRRRRRLRLPRTAIRREGRPTGFRLRTIPRSLRCPTCRVRRRVRLRRRRQRAGPELSRLVTQCHCDKRREFLDRRRRASWRFPGKMRLTNDNVRLSTVRFRRRNMTSDRAGAGRFEGFRPMPRRSSGPGGSSGWRTVEADRGGAGRERRQTG